MKIADMQSPSRMPFETNFTTFIKGFTHFSLRDEVLIQFEGVKWRKIAIVKLRKNILLFIDQIEIVIYAFCRYTLSPSMATLCNLMKMH